MLTLTTLIDGRRESRPLANGLFFIGRGEACQIRLNFSDVSERHAMLSVSGDQVTIKDLNSANGTYVNGVEISDVTLLDGSQVVQIGSSMLRVSDEVEEDVQAAPQNLGPTHPASVSGGN